MIRKFKLELDYWEAVLVIDEEKAAATIKDSVEFWADWKRTLASVKGDYTKAFVDNISSVLIYASIDHGVQWLREEYFNNYEGYCFPLDGSQGILLEYCDEWSFESVDVSEIKA